MPEALYFSCADAHGNIASEEINKAAKMAKERKIAVVVVGLPDSYESEAFDREHMRMPSGYLALVDAVSEANPNTVVVLLGGSVMELPFADRVKAILYMGLPGQAGGEAMADLLTGFKYIGDQIGKYEVSGDKTAFIDMPIYYTHNIKNIGDEELLTIFWINELFNPEDPDTYFEEV